MEASQKSKLWRVVNLIASRTFDQLAFAAELSFGQQQDNKALLQFL